jgi:predicted nucleotidyltransferase
MSLSLAQPELDAITAACRKHQVLRMHLFGSALRDDFDPSRSDLDLLVEFQQIEPEDLSCAINRSRVVSRAEKATATGSRSGWCWNSQ